MTKTGESTERLLTRRSFLRAGAGGLTALVVGSKLAGLLLDESVYAQTQVQSLNFTITDALKDMVTHQDPALNKQANIAQCYFWIYKEATLPAETPGPLIFALEGDAIDLSVTNSLDEDHEFAIPGIGFTTGPIAPGATFTGTIPVPAVSAGTYLYFDPLNAPVNRVMGLHGAFIVMPDPATGTPFNAADPAGAHPNVVRLFADLGAQPWFPGLAWDEEGVNQAPFPNTPPFRQYVWVIHEASPTLFADVGDFQPGKDFPAAAFEERFLNNSFIPGGKNQPPAVQGDAPQFFTISGQSGHFSHNTSFLCPHLRVGEPAVVRVLNAGLWTHCLHIHANHVYLLKVRNEQTGQSEFNAFEDLDPAVVPGVRDNQIWLDTFGAHPMDVWEWAVPYMRPPDVPNSLGIGRADLSFPLQAIPKPIGGFGSRLRNGELAAGPTPPAVSTWPPIQEVNMFLPKLGTKLGPLATVTGEVIDHVPAHVRMSPLCFPMHDHSEATQTAQGGNYNQGMVCGINFIGDRNEDNRLPAPPAGSNISFSTAGVLSFPGVPLTFNDPDFANADADANARAVFGPDFNLTPQPPAGPKPPFEEAM